MVASPYASAPAGPMAAALTTGLNHHHQEADVKI